MGMIRDEEGRTPADRFVEARMALDEMYEDVNLAPDEYFDSLEDEDWEEPDERGPFSEDYFEHLEHYLDVLDDEDD